MAAMLEQASSRLQVTHFPTNKLGLSIEVRSPAAGVMISTTEYLLSQCRTYTELKTQSCLGNLPSICGTTLSLEMTLILIKRMPAIVHLKVPLRVCNGSLQTSFAEEESTGQLFSTLQCSSKCNYITTTLSAMTDTENSSRDSNIWQVTTLDSEASIQIEWNMRDKIFTISYQRNFSIQGILIEVMEAYSPKESSFLSSPYSSPNLGALLKIKIISWSQETGLPVTVRVRVAEKSFNLHKFPLMAKSGYFKRQLSEWQEVELPANFPGGSETFEMIALFIYGSSTFIDPFNVASLICASEFLEMTEAYASGNLSSRTDLYLNQVVLQSWDDTLIVLQKCQTLQPWAEDLLIVSRCIESLAFMACMEILDPERKRERPIASLETLSTHPWSCDIVKETVSQDLWIKDLIALKFGFFKRIISSLRRQGMRERFVSPIIVFYANKWVLSKKTRQFWECLCDKESDNVKDSSDKVMEILQGILDLLLIGEKGSRVIPVGFYFALLARSLELGGLNDGRLKLQEQIIHLLPLAHVEDFLIPRDPNELISSSMELAIMESIFSRYFSSVMATNETPPMGNTIVAELWDLYLVRLARDLSLTVDEFMKLVEVVPVSCRSSHDHLYRAMNVYIQAHPILSQEEKSLVCKQLICQKLSQQVCIEAVQNELMPLRLIVQALFVQQLNTQQAFRHCSDSFRFAYSGDLSGTLSNPKTQNLQESPFTDGSHIANNPLKSLLENELDLQRPDIPRNEYESTSYRIQNLEQELVSLKKSLRLQKSVKETEEFPGFSSKTRSFSKRRDAFGQVTGCIGSVSFSAQRKYAGKLLKIFRRVSLFGRGKLKRRPSVSGS